MGLDYRPPRTDAMTIRTKIEIPQAKMEFELGGDLGLAPPFLRNILPDERPAPNFEGVVPPVVAAHVEARNREATEEDWEDMWNPNMMDIYISGLMDSRAVCSKLERVLEILVWGVAL